MRAAMLPQRWLINRMELACPDAIPSGFQTRIGNGIASKLSLPPNRRVAGRVVLAFPHPWTLSVVGRVGGTIHFEVCYLLVGAVHSAYLIGSSRFFILRDFGDVEFPVIVLRALLPDGLAGADGHGVSTGTGMHLKIKT